MLQPGKILKSERTNAVLKVCLILSLSYCNICVIVECSMCIINGIDRRHARILKGIQSTFSGQQMCQMVE